MSNINSEITIKKRYAHVLLTVQHQHYFIVGAKKVTYI